MKLKKILVDQLIEDALLPAPDPYAIADRQENIWDRLKGIRDPARVIAAPMQVELSELQECNAHGETAFHTLALLGCLEVLPPAWLNEKNLLSKDSIGNTPLHEAASAAASLNEADPTTFSQIPKRLVNGKTLRIPNKQGIMPIHCLAKSGWLGHLPKNILTEDLLLEQDNEDLNALHFACRNKKLAQVPVEFLTQEMLSRGAHGFTAFHAAAKTGCLDQIPTSLLTEKNLCMQDEDGCSPLFSAANNQQLAGVPSHLITVNGMLACNHEGVCPLDQACEHQQIKHVPFLQPAQIAVMEPSMRALLQQWVKPNQPVILALLNQNWDHVNKVGEWAAL